MSPLLLHSNTNQYNINDLHCTYTEMFCIQTCCNHILSAAAGFWGRRQHAMIQEFLSVLFSPQLILQFKEGFQWFYCWENYTYTLPRKQRRPIIFRGEGGPTFSRGVQMLISIETHIRTCYFPGGCPCPLSASGSAPGQCHHNGTIFITVQLLTIIFRHWFVRINDWWGFPNDSLILRMFDTFEKHSSWKFLQFSFFIQKIHHLNAVCRTISVTG